MVYVGSLAPALCLLLATGSAAAEQQQQPPPPGAPQAQAPPPPPPGYPPPGYPPPGYPPPGPPQGYGSYPSQPPPQYMPPPAVPDRIHRHGLMLGFALGGGGVRIEDDSFNGFAFSFNLGGMLTPHLALQFDLSAISHAVDEFGTSETSSVLGATVQYYFLNFLWAKAGLGFGNISLDDAFGQIDSTESSGAFIAAAGGEVLQTTGGFTIDVQLRLTAASFDAIGLTTNTALLVGFNFY
jgi:hypothetical protein